VRKIDPRRQSGIFAIGCRHQTFSGGFHFRNPAVRRLLDTRIRQMFKYLLIFRAKIQVSDGHSRSKAKV
jgi:hypothetical protein